MKEAKLILSEDFIEKVRQYSGAEDSAKMATAGLMAEYWLETGDAIADYRKESKDKSHRWYIESVSASVGMSPSSMYNRSRVGHNVILRGLHEGENSNLSFGHWLAILRNVKKVDGLVPMDELCKRIEWVQKQADKFSGQVPSVRDIDREYRKNGHLTEEAIHWKAIVRNAKGIEKIGHYDDARIMMLVIEIIRLNKEMKNEPTNSR